MKPLFALSILLAAVALTGCEREQPEDTTAFDPKVDAIASRVGMRVDPALGQDQKKIARELRKVLGEATVPPMPGASAPSGISSDGGPAVKPPVGDALRALLGKPSPQETETDTEAEPRRRR